MQNATVMVAFWGSRLVWLEFIFYFSVSSVANWVG
jgi:hypothetical protein